MNGRAASPEPLDDRSSFLDGPFRVVVAMTVVFVVLVASVVVRTAFAPGPTVTRSSTPRRVPRPRSS
jgi:hypothetical protein